MQAGEDTLLTLTADIVAAHVSNNSVAVNDLPNLIQNVHGACRAFPGRSAPAKPKPEPKVPIRSSIKPDYIVCLEDGKRLKMLKRHLMTHYGLTPDQYRQKWGLSPDYPMVAPNYAEQRRTLAKSIGLGDQAPQDQGASIGTAFDPGGAHYLNCRHEPQNRHRGPVRGQGPSNHRAA